MAGKTEHCDARRVRRSDAARCVHHGCTKSNTAPGVSLAHDTARRLGVPSIDIRSQAGHDAYHMAKVCPAAMIFTPCRGGISHNEKEDIELDRTIPAVNVLLHAVLARAM